MFRSENYLPLVIVATVLTFAILVTFQIYQWREPVRLQADEKADLEIAIGKGQESYEANCIGCHGENGVGSLGPALNSAEVLDNANDELLFSLIRTGVPGTAMPAWSQAFGGPLTDEETRQIVAYMRSWERLEAVVQPITTDPTRGAEIFESVCFICHGQQGVGTAQAPALNDAALLNAFDDAWFRETIASGRPSRGMPTWGTVLSPAQIDDLVALLALWRQGETVSPPTPTSDTMADGDGAGLYALHCAVCHGGEGEGGSGPALRENAYVRSQTDQELADLILAGRPGTAMMAFEGRVRLSEIEAIINLLREWQ